MKKFYCFFALFFFSLTAFPQPLNDDCGGLVDLGAAPICPAPGLYNNVNATESNIGMDNFPPCFTATPERDVWFSFQAVATIANYEIILTGMPDGVNPAIVNPQIAVYRGDCEVDGLVLLDCVSAANGATTVSTILMGLTPGLSYFLRINDWSASATPNAGSFQLCVQEQIDTDFLMTDLAADVCSGTLYDSGGPDGNYSNDENLTFSICPTDPHGCILFTLDEYAIEDNFDEMSFYDGPDTNSPLLGELTGLGSNGGAQMGVCYQVAASSGCLTVLFETDISVNFGGFVGHWECTTENCPDDAALTVVSGGDETDLAASFSSPIMDITVTNINCDNQAYGTFNATDATNLGLEDGILLTTGLAAEAANAASFFANNDLNVGGDPDLNFLNQEQGNGATTDDACFVEMDIFVKTNRLQFDYVMGSEEYKQEFSQFSNDMVGILVSGPGIVGEPGLNGQENIAEIPTTGELVQVQTINANNNWQYYRDNNNSQSIAYNGLTTGFMGQPKALTAVTAVTPCETYKVKFAIADIDQNDDSGFFFAPSTAGVPQLEVNFNTGIDYLVEGCTNVSDLLTISLDNPSPVGIDFSVEIGGTATLGVDYLLTIPANITIDAGDTELVFPLSSLADNIAEGTETIEITLVSPDFGCGSFELANFSIDLTEELVVDINNGVDTVFVCEGINSTQLSANGAADFTWSPANLFDNPNSTNPTVTINNSQMVTVTGSLGSCMATDEVFLQIISPTVNIDIQNGGDDQLCQGENIVLFANNNVGNSGLTWIPQQPTPNESILDLTPSFTTTYTAIVSTSGCSVSDELTVTVEPFAFPNLTTTDTLICQNSSVVLATSEIGTGTTFTWTPAVGLDNPTISNPVATPDETTTYTLVATSPNGICTETATTTITVLPADVEIAEESFNICTGESVTFTANTSTNGVGLSWSPAEGLSSTTDETVTATPSTSTWYVATLEVGACVVFDSVLVRVDSLPDMTITAIPDNAPYCEGEIVSLTSPGYVNNEFLNITHLWTPSVGAQSTDTLLNFVVSATETTTYTRVTQNGACQDVSEILIEVVPTPEIMVSPAQVTLCVGQTVDLLVTSPDITEFEWSPSAGLSCNDCPNPTATPPGTITYNVTGEFMGCPANATVLVEVSAGIETTLTDQTICPETSVVLNGSPTQPNTTYEWTLEDGTFFSDEAQPGVDDLIETTTYILTVDNGGCDPVTESITINVVPEPMLTLGEFDEVLCQGLSTTLTAFVDTPNGTFIWSPNGETTASITTSPTDTTDYQVTYISPIDCYVITSETVTINVNSPFLLDSLNTDPLVGFEGETVDLTAFINPDSTQLVNGMFTWNAAGESPFETTNENNVTTTNPQIEDDNQMEIEVTYQVSITDDAGCVETGEITVLVLNSLAEMPNAFTPNGDGNNDVFNLVQSPNVTVSDFRIYNRWGKRVYELSENSNGWNGEIDGNPAAADVYIYVIEYEFGGVQEMLKGDVTLIR